MTPAELMKAILQAPVDLLWNGGIGTYVKSSDETHADAGDKANDAIRVDGRDLRARCVGEGGNLGLTQLGRIEYARATAPSGRAAARSTPTSSTTPPASTPPTTRSTSRSCSTGWSRDGDLTEKQRNHLLAEMTDEVAALVLRDNYEQNLALANAAANAPSLLHVHEDWMQTPRAGGRAQPRARGPADLARGTPPGSSAARASPRPELSVLLAWTKIVLADELIDSDLPDDPYCHVDLMAYFPTQLREGFEAAIASHPLRREIIVTQVVNDLVNGAGMTYWPRLAGETGATPEELTRANFVAREIFGSLPLREEIKTFDNVLDAEHPDPDADRDAHPGRAGVALAGQQPAAAARQPGHGRLLPRTGADADGRAARRCSPVASCVPTRAAARRSSTQRVPEDLASRVAVLHPAYMLLGVIEIADRMSLDPVQVARLHFALGERLGLPDLVPGSWRCRATTAGRRWRGRRCATTCTPYTPSSPRRCCATPSADDSVPGPDRGVGGRRRAWSSSGPRRSSQEICADDNADLARMSVGLRVVRGLLAN